MSVFINIFSDKFVRALKNNIYLKNTKIVQLYSNIYLFFKFKKYLVLLSANNEQ